MLNSLVRRCSSGFVAALVLTAVLVVARPVSAATAVGDQFPNFSALDQDNVTFTLSEHRGRIVLLHVCAGWCGPCLTSAKDEVAVVATVNYLLGSGWQLVDALVQGFTPEPSSQTSAVNWRMSTHTPAETLHGNGDPLSDLSQLKTTIGLEVVPSYYVIGPDGIVSATHFGYTSESSDPLDGDAAVLIQMVIANVPPATLVRTFQAQLMAARMPNGVSQSLIVNLATALKKLTDGNPSHVADAASALDAFIGQVSTFATNKRIPADVAAQLIAAAGAVIGRLE
jgi:hypothetical protein